MRRKTALGRIRSRQGSAPSSTVVAHSDAAADAKWVEDFVNATFAERETNKTRKEKRYAP